MQEILSNDVYRHWSAEDANHKSGSFLLLNRFDCVDDLL